MSDVARPSTAAPDADLAWCHQSLQGVSRTFALTVDVLEEPMSSYICLGYLLCRIADTVEDTDRIDPDEQAALLRLYDDALDPESDTTAAEFRDAVDGALPPAGERSADWEVVAKTECVFATFEELPADVRAAVVPPVRELVGGMAKFVDRYADCGGLRIGTRTELEEYCYYAAGTVGNLITNLLTRGDIAEERARKLHETAEEFGLLLQLVNIAKDVHDDFEEENNVYLPEEWLVAEDVPQEELTAAEHREGTAAVVGRTTALARTVLDDAESYLEHLPLVDGNTIDAWAIPFLLAVGTLRELTASPEQAVDGTGVKVSRKEVIAVVAAMSEHGRDSLPELRAAIAGQPFHLTPSAAD